MTMAGLLASVCQRHGVPVRSVIGPLRHKELVLARKEFCRAALDLGRWSSPQIGAFLGGRDHSSILYLAGRLARTVRK